MCLGKNDWEVFTGSPLYFEEGEFFSDDEFVAADGAFECDGHLCCSFKNPAYDGVKTWNLAFHEARTGIWFPLLGNNNNKHKLPYSDDKQPVICNAH
jgi:hypothetical protein